MNSLLQDVRYAARTLINAPAFTSVAVLTIAIALGATTAVFSLVYGVLLKPLPYREPEQLVRVASVRNAKPVSMSALDFTDYRSQSHSFSSMAAMDAGTMNLTAPGKRPVRLRTARVGASFFGILGMQPVRGRVFVVGDDAPDAPHIVMLSFATWRNQFGGDTGIVDKPISLDGKPYTVIGVAPAWMNYPQKAEAWVPLQFNKDDVDPDNRGSHSLAGVARLASGATVERANLELATIASRLSQQYPESNTNFSAGAFPLQAQMVQDVRGALFMLFAAVGFVLLVACANVANLLLVRASTRETEMAVRTALGAGRWRIVRQLVTESVLLAGMGATVGVLIAQLTVRAVVAFGPAGLPRLDEVAVDGRVLLFAGAITVFTGLLFGIAPAIHAARSDIAGMLKAGSRGSGGRRNAQRMRNGFVVAETALAVILLVGAGLFLRSFARMLAVDPGFQPARVTTATLSLPAAKYPKDHDAGAFADRLLEQVSAQPGIRDAAVGFGRPLIDTHHRVTFEVTGWPRSTPASRHVAYMRSVSPSYFKLLGIPMVSGRGFTSADRADAPQVMIVSQDFVRQYFKNESPLGKHVTMGWGRDTSEWGAKADVGGDIVGIVSDVKEFGPTAEAAAWVYFPFAQAPVGDVSLLVRSELPPAAVSAEIQSAVKQIDPDLPVFDIAAMTGVLSESVGQPRFYTLLLVAFAGVGLLLAAIGIYGVISYGVNARAREIGIRIALGAPRNSVMRLTIRRGMVLAIIGIPIGLAGAFWLRQYIARMLFAPAAGDLITFALVPLVLLAAAAVASFIPARRASRMDPVIAMRAE